MKNWKEAYEGVIDEMMGGSVKAADKELDQILVDHLPGEAFDEVYDQVASLEALHNEAGFKYGYMIGFLTCLNLNGIDSFELKADEANDPVFSIQMKGTGTYDFELVEPLAIAIVNSFLQNFAMAPEFRSYSQYGELIRKCCQRLPGKAKATA